MSSLAPARRILRTAGLAVSFLAAGLMVLFAVPALVLLWTCSTVSEFVSDEG